MKKYFYLAISLIITLNAGQQLSQSKFKDESRSNLKASKHRVLENQTGKSLINKDELIAISNRLKGFVNSSGSLSKMNTQLNQFNNQSGRKLTKINSTILKSNKNNSAISLLSNDFPSPKNLTKRSVVQSVKKEKVEDGEEWIAAMDYLGENRSLFLTKPIINDFDLDIKELSTTQILESGTPISVLTNGSAIIFVDIENNIKLIKTDGTDEEIISSNPVWYSVSISPDGSKLALIPNDIEPYIYISDLNNPDISSKIRIYNPLSADTINDTTLQYADVLTWSADGEYIYYDCLVYEADGTDYWTINLLNVNNGDNTQLFELEDSMQVWGPSASNRGEYLLLDLYDSKTDSITILLVDFNQDLPGIIEENGNSISNAKFSPLDDMVVFERFDSLNGSFVPILTKIALSEDKRIPASLSEQFIDSFRYPVWFIVGGIPVSVEIGETKTVKTKFSLGQNYPNPFNPTTSISYSIPNINIGSMSVKLTIYDVLGHEVTNLVDEVQSPGNYMVNFDGSRLSSGIYYYQLKAGNFRESKKMLLLK